MDSLSANRCSQPPKCWGGGGGHLGRSPVDIQPGLVPFGGSFTFLFEPLLGPACSERKVSGQKVILQLIAGLVQGGGAIAHQPSSNQRENCLEHLL